MRDVRVGHVVPSQHGQRILDQALRRAIEEAGRLVVHARGGDVVGGDEQDVDTHVLGLVVKGAGELIDKGLGGSVGGEERRGVVPGARRHVDNGTRSAVCVGKGEKCGRGDKQMRFRPAHKGEGGLEAALP